MPPARPARFAAERLEQRIAIGRDGRVTARSGKVEYGQGIRTGFARIVADELSIPVATVDIALGEDRQRAVGHGHHRQHVDGNGRTATARRRNPGPNLAARPCDPRASARHPRS